MDLEVVDDGFEGDLGAGRGDEVMARASNRRSSRPVLVVLDLFASDAGAGEVLDGLRDGFAVGFGDVHQHAVHIEYDQQVDSLFQISSSAASRRRVCSRVPTVMRTQPGAS